MPPPPESVTLRTVAPAKINWTLEVLRRRPDGYHEIRSIMQTISLADGLELWPARSEVLTVDGIGVDTLSTADNLVLRAARSFPERSGESCVAFHLSKQIPTAAGLGGGSSDAAAALRLLRRLWPIDASVNLFTVATALGSDTPFFLKGGAQLAEGRGELLTPLPANEPVSLILATPPISLPDKTARLYAQLRPDHYSDGAAAARLAAKLRAGRSPNREDCFNVFDQVADRVFSDLTEYRRTFERITGLEPCLAGAGPSLFGVCASSTDEQASAESIAVLEREGFRAWFVHTVGADAATRIDVERRPARFAP
ncbi:MAG: 4-(cytidine 5'-diphospho)-2-C-methyl-D-erythritol kinase [Dehalococcoidia bacterium]